MANKCWDYPKCPHLMFQWIFLLKWLCVFAWTIYSSDFHPLCVLITLAPVKNSLAALPPLKWIQYDLQLLPCLWVPWQMSSSFTISLSFTCLGPNLYPWSSLGFFTALKTLNKWKLETNVNLLAAKSYDMGRGGWGLLWRMETVKLCQKILKQNFE